MHSWTSGLGCFADVRQWLLARGGGFGEVRSDDCGAVMLARPRCEVAVVEAGGQVPKHFDVIVIAGAGAQLAEAVAKLHNRRVSLLPLPATAELAHRVLLEATKAADAFVGARTAEQLLEIGRALNAEREPDRLLDLILKNAREMTRSDAGSIYCVEAEGTRLRFCCAYNDSVETDFTEFTLPVSDQSIVGTAVLSGRAVLIEDLYESGESVTHGRRFQHDRSFDDRLGYQTRSMITTPVVTPQGRVAAVIQLINARRDFAGPLRTHKDFATRVREFTEDDERLCAALAAQAAVALDNAQLYADIRALFEGFVRASVHAIEQRDPTTSGHSQRVADVTVALAKAVDRSSQSEFAKISFTPEALKEIEYAGLLHDFGKVGVREEILVKAKKLYPHQLALMHSRFDHLRTTLALRHVTAQLERVRAGGSAGNDNDLHAKLAQVERWLALVGEANEPTLLAHETSSQLEELLAVEFTDTQGQRVQVVGANEVEALQVPRGSLTCAERREIEGHVSHTFNFLIRIPWTPALARVPEIAAKHHEYLDGSGYPGKLPSPEIPLQARMMTVADIYDALTASDRPYKKAVPFERALDILHQEVDRGKVDPVILKLFIESRSYEAAQPAGQSAVKS